MYQILDVISSQSFIEKALLLILTAVLTGVLVPYINAKLADRKFKGQRLFEAEIARQSKIIDSQNELLKELERLVHIFQQRALAIAWYKTYDKNPKRFQESRDTYEDNAWEFFISMRTVIGKANRLTSPETLEELERFYDEMKDLDMELVNLLKNDVVDKEWVEFSNKFKSEYPDKLEKMINLLAQDYGLSNRTKYEGRT